MKTTGMGEYSSILLNRFRDLKQLKYLLRSIEENGKEWARRIFLVTNNQVPDYVNINHTRIRIVSHQQLFEYAKVKPPKYQLFNSIAIQSMIHTIPTLSSPFYLFDDDIVIRKSLPTTVIMSENKSVIDLNANKYLMRVKPQSLYDAHLQSAINMVLKRNRPVPLLGANGRYSIGSHGPLLLYREIGMKIWDEFRPEMNLLISHPFRMPTDPSIQTLYIYMGYSNYYTFARNRNMLRFEMLSSYNPEVTRRILQKTFQDKSVYFVCVNDNLRKFNEEHQTYLNEVYETVFPKRSSFDNN
ncbi:unnamed protein product [Rotaria socialis]|uniref:Stealth protein CR2 conserved region 2 domain-containing protein n=1 Tax=Rotaria socialis TaxID=392032 RepID=A0A820J516_9BILA|nr:unnamed protein product [Rotaria socialis]CAF3311234.1 unnamed protein product [Rotaria socialis]CAF3318847.1 unnamed protein product [Rotaria socialis]CAF4318422.1 unnamed protein product [Rotaria socialis]CAF4320140.1 unnamed protein product [Rotaria socialis]